MASSSFSIPDMSKYQVRVDFGNPFMSTPSSPWATPFAELKLSGDITPKASSNNGAKPTPASIIEDIRKVAKDHGADLSGVKGAVENIETERKMKIVHALQGVADLELLKGTKGRRFLVVYWYGNEAQTTQGIEYPVGKDGDGDVIGYSVWLDDEDHPFSHRYKTMADLRKYFDERKLPCHVAYFDN